MNSTISFFKTVVCLILAGLLAVGCQESVSDISLDLVDKRMVVYAELPFGEPANVFLSSSISDTNVPFSFESQVIKGATVMLYAEGMEIEQLQYDEDTKSYASEYLIEYGKSYIIKASHPDFPAVESEPVAVPAPLEALTYDTLRPAGIDCFHEIPKQVNIRFRKPEEMTYYQVVVSNIVCSPIVVSNGSCDDVIIGADELEGPIFPSDCVDGSTVDVQVLSGVFYNPDFGEEALEVELRLVSASKYLFESSLEGADSFDEGFVEPRRTFTNVQNGYGVVFGSRKEIVGF